MAEMIATRLCVVHAVFEKAMEVSSTLEPDWKDEVMKVKASLEYLKLSVQAQKRWLLSYKYRKDIAMNLVFNLVTQQDSATTTVIARETKADSSSMKTIAALTMVFLPGTFMSSVFSMGWVTRASWHLYVGITLPLTGFVIFIWWLWTTKKIVRPAKENFIGSRRNGMSVPGENTV
ncbi:hypothetical protein HYFRA_00009446 [Hymenoscyphus fraxineus]|uniref:Uncharacterized protein n=1 Tax=Hymenoscyphus fraxineus TaxID=746836 RepID=A0A9N9PKK9_9HELO|nr:hypothetical protein HYFRA_00009446 [Hymenoscyphus fraxineus]